MLNHFWGFAVVLTLLQSLTFVNAMEEGPELLHTENEVKFLELKAKIGTYRKRMHELQALQEEFDPSKLVHKHETDLAKAKAELDLLTTQKANAEQLFEAIRLSLHTDEDAGSTIKEHEGNIKDYKDQIELQLMNIDEISKSMEEVSLDAQKQHHVASIELENIIQKTNQLVLEKTKLLVDDLNLFAAYFFRGQYLKTESISGIVKLMENDASFAALVTDAQQQFKQLHELNEKIIAFNTDEPKVEEALSSLYKHFPHLSAAVSGAIKRRLEIYAMLKAADAGQKEMHT